MKHSQEKNQSFLFLTSPSVIVPILLILFLTIAYSNSFQGSFVFDDLNSIPGNPTIRDLKDSFSFISMNGETVSGRPVLNFTLALNYAVGRLAVEGYHILNFLIHLAATFALYGFLRKTLELPSFTSSVRRDAAWIAGGIAGLWALHPLQTESVTYVIQRAESLMGLFYLLTLYFFISSLDSKYARVWLGLSVVSSYMGMGTKEVMVSAPIVVALYDRVFILGSLREIWKVRRGYYLFLASSWAVLLMLMVFTEGRGTTAGFSNQISVIDYLQTQCWALVHYGELVFWPSPLVFDYGVGTVTDPVKVFPCAFLILLLLGLVGWSFWRFPRWSFWGIWALFILLPSSSIIPVTTQTIAEHRIYLALAPFLYCLLLGGYLRIGKWIFWPIFLWGLGLCFLTYQRNEDYRTVESLWKSTVQAAPLNPRAHNNYGGELLSQGKLSEAEAQFKETLQLDPTYVGAYNNLGYLYQQRGLAVEAEKMYRCALRLDPKCSDSYLNLALLLEQQGKIQEAMALYRKNLETAPHHFKSLLNLGNLCLKTGNIGEAEALYRRCIAINPEDPTGYNNWAYIFELRKDMGHALQLYEHAIKLDPSFVDARYNLALALQKQKDYANAIEQLKVVLKLRPGFVDAQENYANLHILQGDEPKGFQLYQEIVRQRPTTAQPYLNLGALYEHRGDLENAGKLYQEALRLDPKNEEIQKRIQVVRGPNKGSSREKR